MRRKTVLAIDETYHIYNRGVEKRPIFQNNNDYIRFLDLINYYRFANCPLRFSFFKRLPILEKARIMEDLEENSPKLVEIFTFCLMPNHFHLLIRQVMTDGVSKFITKITNGYSHYFNLKYDRVGHLFQGNFGAVRIEDDEQLLHVNRYIHLNPVTSYLIKFKDLEKYKYSSYPGYLNIQNNFHNTEEILSRFKTKKLYQKFIENQVDYARHLDKIKHLTLE